MGDPFMSLGGFLGKKGGLPSWKLGPGGNVGAGSKTGIFRKLRFHSRSQVEAATARSRDALAQLFAEVSAADALAVVGTVGLAPTTLSRFNAVKDRLGLLDTSFSQSMSSSDLTSGGTDGHFLLSMPLGGLPPSRAVEGPRRASIQVATLSRPYAIPEHKASTWKEMNADDLVTESDLVSPSRARRSLQAGPSPTLNRETPAKSRDGAFDSGDASQPTRTESGDLQVLLRPATSMGTAERITKAARESYYLSDPPAPTTPPRPSPVTDVATPTVSPASDKTIPFETKAPEFSAAELESPVSARHEPAQQRPATPSAVATIVRKEARSEGSPQIKMFDWSRLELQQKLGSGSFSDVHLAVLKGSKGQPNIKVAVKVDTSGGASTLVKEAKMICKLKHPNLVRIFGVTTQPIALVSEVVPNGSLSSFLRKHGERPLVLGMTQTLQILRDIAEGLRCLHSQQPPIVHRDLSANNVLLDKNLRAKVSDFGLSKWQKHSCVSNSSKSMGTASYMAPEVLSNGKITEKADVFSFGVLVWECLTGREPWQNLNPFQIIYQVCFTDQQLEVPEGCPPALASLMRQCWSKNPEDRPLWPAVLDAIDQSMPQRPALVPAAALA